MSDDLVGDPVEYVEDEECHRKSCSGDRVYPLGSVYKPLLYGFDVFWGMWLRIRSYGSILNSCAIFCRQTLAHAVAREVKSAFLHIVILGKNT